MAAGRMRTILPLLQKLASRGDDPTADGELLRRFSAGRDESAFAEIVRRHGPMLLRVCRCVLRNAQDAEDVCQATFLMLAQKAASVRWHDSVAGWLFQTAYRLSLKARTTANRRRHYEDRARPTPVPGPVAELSAREFQSILDAELSRLPDKYRAPILLCCLEGKSRDEAARFLGWTLTAVKDRLEQGRERLRARLARRGVLLGTALASFWLLETPAQAGCGNIVPHALAKAALSIAAGNAPLAGHLPAWLAELAKGATKAMFVRHVMLLAVVGSALGLGVAGVALGLPDEQQPAREQTPPPKPATADAKSAKPAPEQSSPKKGTPVDAASVQPESLPLTGHKGLVRAIAFSRDGKKVATAGVVDKTLRIWDSATGQQIAKMDLPGDGTGVAFSPDGKKLAVGSGGRQGGLACVDAVTGKAIWQNGGMRGCTGGVSFSPDGRQLAAGFEPGSASVIDAPSGKFMMDFSAPQSGVVVGAAFSPDAKLLAFGTSKGFVHLLDGAAGRMVRRFGQGNGSVTALAFLPDGRTLAVADGGQAVRILDLATGKEDKAFLAKKAIWAFAISPDGKLAVIARE